MTVSLQELGTLLTTPGLDFAKIADETVRSIGYTRKKTFDGTSIPYDCERRKLISQHEFDVGCGVRMFIEHFKLDVSEYAQAYTIDQSGAKEILKGSLTGDSGRKPYSEFYWKGKNGIIGPCFRRDYHREEWYSGGSTYDVNDSLTITPYQYTRKEAIHASENGKEQTFAFERDAEGHVMDTFRLARECLYKKGKRIHSKSYYQNGQVKEECVYEGNLYKLYYENGQIAEEGSCQDDYKDGPFKSYDENGHLIEEGSYRRSLKDGPYKRYYKNGQIAEEGTYKSNRDFAYIPSADFGPALEFYHAGYSECGPYTSYYENGKIKEKGYYEERTSTNGYRENEAKKVIERRDENGKILEKSEKIDGEWKYIIHPSKAGMSAFLDKINQILPPNEERKQIKKEAVFTYRKDHPKIKGGR